MEMRTGHRWRFDIDSPTIPNSNLSEKGLVPIPTGPFPDDYGPDYNLEWDPFPTLPETIALPALKIIYWNSGEWNRDKATSMSTQAGIESADIIFITNLCTVSSRNEGLIEALSARLRKSTNKTWRGIPSPNRHQKKGGTFVMFSDLILDPEIIHYLPHGKLTHLTGSWHNRNFNILSAFRPHSDNIPLGTTITDTMHENEALLWSFIGEYSEDLCTLLLGDFGLTSTQLDKRLRDEAPESRRIAHTLSDFHNQMALSDTVSGGAFSIWNGPGSPRSTPLPTTTSNEDDSSCPIVIEIKFPPLNWHSLAFSEDGELPLHKNFPTQHSRAINKSAAPPEERLTTTKGGHNDDQKI